MVSSVTLLGLMQMRPLQHWLRTRVQRWAWHHGSHCVNITQLCRRTFGPWEDISFLRAGVPVSVSVPPWQIPLRKGLFSHGKGTIWHPRPDLWNLHVGPWTRQGGTRRSFTSTGEYHYSGLYSAVRPEVMRFRELVFFPEKGPSEMWHRICALLPPRRPGQAPVCFYT